MLNLEKSSICDLSFKILYSSLLIIKETIMRVIRQSFDLNSNIITKNTELILPTGEKTPVYSGKSCKMRVVENIYSKSNSDKKSLIKAKILSSLKIGSENLVT